MKLSRVVTSLFLAVPCLSTMTAEEVTAERVDLPVEQAVAETTVWDEASVAQLAAQRHEAIVAARANVAASLESVRQSAASRRPTITAQASYQRESVEKTQLTSGEDQYALSARVEQILWDFDRRQATVDAATARSKGSQADLRGTIRDIRIAARRALVDWQVADQRLAIGEARRQQLEQEWQELSQRVDAGLNPAIDARLAELQLIDSQNQINDLSSAVASSRLAMSQAVAIPVADLPTVAELTRPDQLEQRLSDAEALVANSPELDRLRAQGLALQADQSSLKAGNLPEVAAFASGSSSWADDNDPRESLLLGVAVRWSWDGGGRSAGQAALINQYRALSQQRDLLIRQRHIILDDLRQQFSSLAQQIERQQRAIALAEQNEIDTQAAFRAGITTLTRRNEATLRVAEARFALADLIYRERQLAISLDQFMAQ